MRFSNSSDEELLKALGVLLEDANTHAYDLNSFKAQSVNSMVDRLLLEIKKRKIKMIKKVIDNE